MNAFSIKSKNILWSERRGSNSRHQPWQGCTLPTELLSQLQYKNNTKNYQKSQYLHGKFLSIEYYLIK